MVPGRNGFMTKRSKGREVALQVLYQLEQNAGVNPDELRLFVERRLRDEKVREYAEVLISGVRKHLVEIDGLISQAAENWRIDRMAAIDRNILRIGAFEIIHRTEIPRKVAINEALELAKRYSTAHSSRFVNGVLDRLRLPGETLQEDPIETESALEPEVKDEIG